MDRRDYVDDAEWQRFLEFSGTLETPCVVVDLKKIEAKYAELTGYFPYADVYYAVKANPAPEIITLLARLGSNFDIASRYELDELLNLGIAPERMSCGNTIKKAKDVAYFYEKGVRLFTTDSKDDLLNISRFAPGSRISVRILSEHSGSADWPLSRKFGCHPDMAYDLVVAARDLGLVPYGISFHVGSQQRDIGQWNDAIVRTKYLLTSLEEEEDIKIGMINMGGGLPATYAQPTNALAEYASEITRYLHDDFGDNIPKIILEPGRSLVADSGILVSEVVLISRKNNTSLNRWVYLDAGVFNGLTETLEECIKYRIVTSKDCPGCKRGEVVLAGPTCDSMDVMYEQYRLRLPLALRSGDRMYFLSAGAYTSSYASVSFNGFPPIKTYFMPT